MGKFIYGKIIERNVPFSLGAIENQAVVFLRHGLTRGGVGDRPISRVAPVFNTVEGGRAATSPGACREQSLLFLPVANQALRRARLAGGRSRCQSACVGTQRIAIRPRIERIVAQRGDELAAVHAHVARPRRDRPGLVARNAHQAVRVVSAHAVDDLRDLVEAQPPPAPPA